MEQFSLPFPTLQYLAGHAVVRRVVLMKVDKAYWNMQNSLRECELRIDKLTLTPPTREYVKNVLKGFFEQVSEWDSHMYLNESAVILCDARGNLDERQMARHHFEKRYKDQFFREDFQHFVHFLEHLSWYHPSCCSNNFVRIILELQKVNTTTIVGPECRLVEEELEVLFRFVNHRRHTRRSMPPEFNALLEWNKYPLEISMEQNDVLVTYTASIRHYDEDMFRIHVDLLQPSDKLWFVKRVVYSEMMMGFFQQVFCFLNVLDSELRRDSVLGMNEYGFNDLTYNCLECWLIPGYEALFIPMMRLVGLNLTRESYFRLFDEIVAKVNLIGFDSLLLQFWELLPTTKKSHFQDALVNDNDKGHKVIKEAMKTLSRENMPQFRVVFNDVTASLTKEEACNLFCVILV